ncbi:hypothetical protein BCR34DRAFT_622140 [Clohesyomyces aquaticus]|uniref:Uncharacterized protein n=1 Tax=Clohesyomyces aquaticus TaxID=1231657 RepID=A0A1Y2A313_9PLEO|nr:hypothetical protein BCR34DRAFT_622140 [Clohesyomyces aquaticus]
MPQAILIVGGGLGIGFEVKKFILAASASAKVVTFSGRLSPVLGDVTSAPDRKKAMETCVQQMGGIDTLRTDKVDIEDVKTSYDINVFGAMTMSQLCLPHLRKSRSTNPTNVAFGKAIILSPGSTLTRFIQLLAHEETTLSIQGVYPKLTRTKMPEDVTAGKYRDEMVEPASCVVTRSESWPWVICGRTESGEALNYDEHVSG